MSKRERLPCGCIIDSVGDTFTIEPCAADCENLRYAVEESKRQGLPVSGIADPEADAGAVNAVDELLRYALGNEDGKP